jgi:hypothetical protein
VTSPQILRCEGQRKKTDNRKQRVHLGNGRGIHQGPLFEPSLAIIGITEVRIQIDEVARLGAGKIGPRDIIEDDAVTGGKGVAQSSERTNVADRLTTPLWRYKIAADPAILVTCCRRVH